MKRKTNPINYLIIIKFQKMKKISAIVVMGFFLFTAIFSAQAQELINTNIQVKAIEPYPLTITYSKTTSIIFPYAIISVDRGSKDVLAQKAEGVQNVLQVKAAKQNFQQTNLTVITADGKLISFIVDYAEQPSVLNLSLTNGEKKNSVSILSNIANQAEVQEYAKLASVSKEKARGVKDKRFGICVKLNGLFIHDNIMYLRMSIANKTNINYDIDELRVCRS
jgi:conjugative transposon TraN protein